MEGEKKPEKLSEALVVAQSQMRHAKMDRVNPHYKNRYATLASVIDACKPALNAVGIAVVQEVESNSDAGTVGVRTVLHFRGEMLDCGLLTLKAVQNNPQQIGSALTYARRYALAAAIGIASDEDDDGEAAQGRQVQGGDAPQPRPSSHARTSEVVGAVALAPPAAPRVTVTVAKPAPSAPPPTSPAHADAPEGGPDFVMLYGKHKGVKASEIPIGYLEWAVASMTKLNDDERDVCRALIALHNEAKGEGRQEALAPPPTPPASAQPPDDDEPPPHGDDDVPF